jgi:uncharacterized membrane-anchored protein
VALYVSYPPDYKNQEDAPSALCKNDHKKWSFLYLKEKNKHGILFMMKSILSSSIFLFVILCASFFIFDPTHLYYELPWLDIPMHVLGGIGISFFYLAVEKYRKKTISYKKLLVFYLIIAIGWELYEIVKDTIHSLPWNSTSDTVSDVINGWVGVCVGYFISKKK